MACKIRIRVKKKKYIRGDNTTMKYTSIIIPFVGGLGMFIYGMQIMAQGAGECCRQPDEVIA